MVENIEFKCNGEKVLDVASFHNVEPENLKRFAAIKSKDTLDIQSSVDKEYQTLRSCILISKGDGSNDKVCIKKAKSVHFADSLGKPLKSVKTLFEFDDELEMSLLSLGLHSSSRRSFTTSSVKGNLLGHLTDAKGKFLNFKLPLNERALEEKLNADNICLESVVFREYSIFGTVVVNNICYQKQVSVLYTIDDWKSKENVLSNYISSSSNGKKDIFSFEIVFPSSLKASKIIVKFALCYSTEGNTFWDSNCGKNYEVEYNYLLSEKISDSGFILPSQNFVGWST
ncbi:protein phosphatase 1 regulatory subunit 3B-B [Hydra vulgaris]|uniref:Protein phosphatase 1 regulatory subunit 3B-B n=1 Tax=Hydra vulgaris TaxID=6087 RepID=A0ABM4BIV3_HYDVU